ncbi:hypothetical protein L596_019546 [Steinernema carpocapsae]|uniref:Uncharacterized protein n=1 Tax=Steinernema carpocapsae TaxID=34508 RepID=A0A4U5MRN6_STECR|nr:hypothetical protein L596_019546 [Steinernema carpocapsae]
MDGGFQMVVQTVKMGLPSCGLIFSIGRVALKCLRAGQPKPKTPSMGARPKPIETFSCIPSISSVLQSQFIVIFTAC